VGVDFCIRVCYTLIFPNQTGFFVWLIRPFIEELSQKYDYFKLMIKLTTIKYIFYKQAMSLPKYMALTGLICSSVLPFKAALADTESTKPALLALAQTTMPSYSFNQAFSQDSGLLTFLYGSAITGQMNPLFQKQSEAKKPNIQASVVSMPSVNETRKVLITAYSSTPDQTDDSPFITAMGSTVRDGIVACNFLKFGTKVRIPEVYGDKIFVVEDRMAKKNSHKIDIWMESRAQALEFGVKYLTVEILES